jgi:hypothetical protein
MGLLDDSPDLDVAVEDYNEVLSYTDDLETYANELEARLALAEKPADVDNSALQDHLRSVTGQLAEAQARLHAIGLLTR